jgi:hypothetical protein
MASVMAVIGVIENFPISIMEIKSIMNIRVLIGIMETRKFSITAITEVIPKVGYILSYSCGKNEFPGKRYNASNLVYISQSTTSVIHFLSGSCSE